MQTTDKKIKIKWSDIKSKLEEEYENITGDDFTFSDTSGADLQNSEKNKNTGLQSQDSLNK